MADTTLKVTEPVALRRLADDLGVVGPDGIIPLRDGLPFFSERARGVRIHHDMGAAANLGQMRLGAGGRVEIYEGAGGAESYEWHAFDPNRADQVERAALYQRYGANWSSGGIPVAPFSGHAPDIRAQLEEMLGRKVNLYEWQDRVYGVAGAPSGTVPQPSPTPTPTPTPAPSRDYAALLRDVLAKIDGATKKPKGEIKDAAGGGRFVILLRSLLGELDKIRSEAARQLA